MFASSLGSQFIVRFARGTWGDFFAELRRRHIYRVPAANAVVTWVLLQLVKPNYWEELDA